jgi:hypothetical protein
VKNFAATVISGGIQSTPMLKPIKLDGVDIMLNSRELMNAVVEGYSRFLSFFLLIIMTTINIMLIYLIVFCNFKNP